MQSKLIGLLENEDNSLSTGLYQMPSGEYRLWLKIGVGLLEVKQEQIKELKDHLTQMENIIEGESVDI